MTVNVRTSVNSVTSGALHDRAALRVLIVDDEPLARAVVREFLGAHPGRRGGRRVRQRLRRGESGVGALARSHVPRRADAEAERLRGARAPRPGRPRDLHHRLRPVRAARVRSPRGRLPAEAVQRGALRRGAVARAGTPAVARARRRSTRSSSEVRSGQAPLERVLIRDGSQVHVLPVDRIDYVEAQDDYVCVQVGGETVPEGPDARHPRRPCWIPRGSSAFTGRISSTSIGSRASSSTPRTAASRSCATAPACRSAVPATRGWRSCSRTGDQEIRRFGFENTNSSRSENLPDLLLLTSGSNRRDLLFNWLAAERRGWENAPHGEDLPSRSRKAGRRRRRRACAAAVRAGARRPRLHRSADRRGEGNRRPPVRSRRVHARSLRGGAAPPALPGPKPRPGGGVAEAAAREGGRARRRVSRRPARRSARSRSRRARFRATAARRSCSTRGPA